MLDEVNLIDEKPVDVYVRMTFTKIHEIDTLNQRFQAESLIELKWYDPSVHSVHDDIAKLDFNPEIYMENSINDLKEEKKTKIVFDREKGLPMVSEIRKIKGLFWENLELQNFPLDIQDLSISLASKKSGRKVNFILMQPEFNKTNLRNTLDKSMWHLHDVIKVQKEFIETDFSFGKREYPSVKLTCQAFRLAGYFYWNAILPIVLITFAVLGPFVIDHKQTQSRMSSTASLLLSSVSFKAVVNRLLPTVSYLTSLDKYSLGSIVIISLIFIYHSLLAAFSAFLNETTIFYLDKFAFCVFCSLIMGKQAIYAIWLLKVEKYRKKLKKEHLFHDVIKSQSIDVRKKDN